MADAKITDLTIGVPVGTDLVPYASDPTGSPSTKAAYLGVGTYTPTLGNVANLSASAVAGDFTYIRIGNMVHVAGPITQDAVTTALSTVLSITVPIASNFSSSFEASGVAGCASSGEYAGTVYSDAAGDFVNLQTYPISVANRSWRVSFMYKII